LYFQPKTTVAGDFRQRFANPTPLGFMGFSQTGTKTEPRFAISTATFSMVLMGWGGATTLTSVAYYHN
jgi:succinate-acetate transporter protein